MRVDVGYGVSRLCGGAAARSWCCRCAVGAHPSYASLFSALLAAGDASSRTKAVDAFGVAAGVAVFWCLAGLVLGLFSRKVTERCVLSVGPLVAFLFLNLFILNKSLMQH